MNEDVVSPVIRVGMILTTDNTNFYFCYIHIYEIRPRQLIFELDDINTVSGLVK